MVFRIRQCLWFVGVAGFLCLGAKPVDKTARQPRNKPYEHYVKECLDCIMEHGTDRYGTVHAPIVVSILDVESKTSPEYPEKLDEYYRVTRRGRRNPAGSNLLTDQSLFKTMYLVSNLTGSPAYADFAQRYAGYVMSHLVDDKGFFWWGWHRHYDVYRDIRDGHNGDPHEIQSNNCIAWDRMWHVNQRAVQKEIEAIWQWHVIDKNSGEINRHGDGKRGCDFSMSNGAYIEAFCLYMGKRVTKSGWIGPGCWLIISGIFGTGTPTSSRKGRMRVRIVSTAPVLRRLLPGCIVTLCLKLLK
jgi:hypothetical protein